MRSLFRNTALFFLIGAGCLQPQQPPQEWSATCTLQPIICEGSGWTPTEIDKQTRWLNVAYGRAAITFVCQATVVVADERFLDFDDADLPDLNGHGESVARAEGLLAVWFVGTIHYKGQKLSGLAYYPYGYPGAQYGAVLSHAAAMAQVGEKTLCHELGHSLGLPHPWEDDIADTLQDSIEQGCSVQPCLLMNYCWSPQIVTGECEPADVFTDGQVDELRRWATSYTRSMMFRSVGTLPATERQGPVRSVSEPAIDPVFPTERTQ